jgi:MSHA biogenesis protein MshQ
MVSPPVLGGAFNAGRGSLRLQAPGAGRRGSVDVSVNLSGVTAGASCTAGMPASTASSLSFLQGAWCGATYTNDPTARATFGIYRNSNQFIYQQENY